MKTKLLLTLTAAAALGTTSLFAGPGPQFSTAPRTARLLAAPVAEMKCATMQINSGGKSASTQTVACASYAKVRPTECRLACAR